MYNDDYLRLNHTTKRVDNLIEAIKRNIKSDIGVIICSPIIKELEVVLSELIDIGKGENEKDN